MEKYWFTFSFLNCKLQLLTRYVQWCRVEGGRREEMLVFLYLTMCTTSTKKKTKCMLLGEGGGKKIKKAVKTVDKKRPKCAHWLAVIL